MCYSNAGAGYTFYPLFEKAMSYFGPNQSKTENVYAGKHEINVSPMKQKGDICIAFPLSLSEAMAETFFKCLC